jgi:hypothetical protein
VERICSQQLWLNLWDMSIMQAGAAGTDLDLSANISLLGICPIRLFPIRLFQYSSLLRCHFFTSNLHRNHPSSNLPWDVVMEPPCYRRADDTCVR